MLTQPGRATRPVRARYSHEQAPPALKQTFTAALGSAFCQCQSGLASGARWGCPSFNQAPALLLSPFPSAEPAGSGGCIAPADCDAAGLVPTGWKGHHDSSFGSGAESSLVLL